MLEQYARRIIVANLLNKSLDALRSQARAEAERIKLPANLRQQVEALLQRKPDIPWDLAVAAIAQQTLDRLGLTAGNDPNAAGGRKPNFGQLRNETRRDRNA